ncbi:MAG TPA: curli assembly protein CsgF [Balneolaceae bacterium]|nr:curli assembly protein CsgF [Balneolaceae bacterium]
MKRILSYSFILIIPLFILLPQKGRAQDFVYTPKDPAFGGSYLNYSWLLNSANAQNLYQKSSNFGFNQNPLQNFQQTLQEQVLSQLTQKVIQQRFGKINLKKKSSYQFGQFSINVIPGSNGVNINISDNSSGQQTTITIPNF